MRWLRDVLAAVFLFLAGFLIALVGYGVFVTDSPPEMFEALAAAPALSTVLAEDVWSDVSNHVDGDPVGLLLHSSEDEEHYLLWEAAHDVVCVLQRLKVAFDATESRWTYALVCDDADTAEEQGIFLTLGPDHASVVSLLVPDGYHTAVLADGCSVPVERNLVRFGRVDLGHTWDLPPGSLPTTVVLLEGPAGELTVDLPVGTLERPQECLAGG